MEVILSLAGEGGKVSIKRVHENGKAKYFYDRDESAVIDFLDEEDNDLLDVSALRSDDYGTLREALERFNESWFLLTPRFVHPTYSLHLWQLLTEQNTQNLIDLDAWKHHIFKKNPVYEAAELIKHARRMVVLTGAGMSVDSGVPDFRSASGWWRKIDPRTVATVQALESDYDLFHAFYSARIEGLRDVRPHEGHFILRHWQEEGNLKLIATQNVDGLHQVAGSRQVQELHGSIKSFRCHRCGMAAEKESFINKKICICGGKLRPNVVLFGESLPEAEWNISLRAIEQADIILIIGTSLHVYPVSELPFLTKGKIILINPELTGKEDRFHTVITGRAEESIQAINSWITYMY